MIQWKFQQPGLRLRHPLARLAAAVLGIVLIVGIGLFALGALAIAAIALAIAMAVRRFGPRKAPAMAAGTAQAPLHGDAIDGEFVVIEPGGSRRSR